MGSDPGRFVIYRPTPFDTAYRLTDHDGPPTDSEIDRLETAWGFLDTFIAEARDRAVHIEDRIDAQSLVWSIAKNAPPDNWSRRDQRAFERYRSGKELSMGQALTVYVGTSSESNPTFSLGDGRWGWKAHQADYDGVQPGDVILLASDFTGGSPRKQPADFAQHGFGRVAIGRITSRIAEESSLYWPDEVSHNQLIYPFRLTFELIDTRVDVTLGELEAEFHGSLSEGFRHSATGGGKGVLVEIEADLTIAEETAELDEIVESFAGACTAANLDYGQRHLLLVRSFVTSLATKRFADPHGPLRIRQDTIGDGLRAVARRWPVHVDAGPPGLDQPGRAASGTRTGCRGGRTAGTPGTCPTRSSSCCEGSTIRRAPTC